MVVRTYFVENGTFLIESVPALSVWVRHGLIEVVKIVRKSE